MIGADSTLHLGYLGGLNKLGIILNRLSCLVYKSPNGRRPGEVSGAGNGGRPAEIA